MKSTLFVLALLGSSLANASFEIVLAVDFIGGKIDRFDGISGTSFGSFGAGSLGNSATTCMDIDRKTGLAYIGANLTTVQVWNYNTGEFNSSFFVGGAGRIRGIYIDNSGNLLLGTDAGYEAILKVWNTYSYYRFNGAEH